MASTDNLVKQIVDTSRSLSDGKVIIHDLDLGCEGPENELLLFVKPEVFMIEDLPSMERTLRLVFSKIEEFNATIHGMILVSGKLLEGEEIMNKHYGYINDLSRNGSKIISQEDQLEIKQALDIPLSESIQIYGAHEYLAIYPNNGLKKIEEIWDPSKSIKLRSGFYFLLANDGSSKFVLVNGFHPAQLAHFTGPNRKLLLVILRSGTKWRDLRNKMIGATFPEKAEKGSIRNLLYANPREYGFTQVTIENNGVHLSAGPFEAAFEIHNFIGKIFKADLEIPRRLNLIKRMMDYGVEFEAAYACLSNPSVINSNGSKDLFSLTEDFDTKTAINFWLAKNNIQADVN